MWRNIAIRASTTTNRILRNHEKLPLQITALSSSYHSHRFFSDESVSTNHLSSSEDESPTDPQFIENPDTLPDPQSRVTVDPDALDRVRSLLRDSPDITDTSFSSIGEIPAHPDFLLAVIGTPEVPAGNLLKFYQFMSRKPGFCHGGGVLDELVFGFVNDGNVGRRSVYALWDLVKEVGGNGEVGVVSVGVLNGILGVLGRMGKGKAVLEVFDKFGQFGCVPDSDSFYLTIEGLGRRSFFDWACSVSDRMVEARCLPKEGEKVGKVISWLCKGKKGESAFKVYVLAKELEIVLPKVAVDLLVGSLCRDDGTVGLAREMLDGFKGKSREYAIKPFSSVIRGLCRIKDVNGAKKLLLKMVLEGLPPGNAVFNSVISAYAKAGDMGESIALMKMMESRGLKPDVYTYTVIISGYANGGQMEEAHKILLEAKKNHSKLSPVTYHTLIRGYCKLEEFDKAMKLFGEMKRFGVKPNADEYNKLIQSLCLKALDWESAEKLLAEMKKTGLHLNGITRGLIRAVKEMEIEEAENTKVTLEA